MTERLSPMEMDAYRARYLEGLLRADRRLCASITDEFLADHDSVKALYEHVYRDALYEVGKMWEQNRISVASEHIATAMTEAVMNRLFDRLISEKRSGRVALVACTEGEQHQVGCRMVADILEMHGWETRFLGASAPMKELVRFVEQNRVDLVALSVSVYFNMRTFVRMVEDFGKKFPDLPIIVGGQALRHGGPKQFASAGHVKFLANLDALEAFLRKFQ